MELLTQKDFANLIGISPARVNKLVKAGRIPMIDKKIPKDDGVKAYHDGKVLGFEKAAIAGKIHGGNPKTTKKNINGYDQDNLDDEDSPHDGDLGARYNKAKTEEKEWMAKKRQLEYEVEKKKYVLISDVKDEAQKLASMVRQKIMGVAPMIAASAEGKTANQIQRIVEIELNEALKALQDMGV